MQIRPLSCFIPSLLFLTAEALAAPLPVSGLSVPELQVIDTTMQNFMQQNGIGAGVAAIMKDGVPVYRRAFGWQEAGRSVPLGRDSIFRLASVTKPLTAAVIRNLISGGWLNLNDLVFDSDFLFFPEGLLDYVPFGTPKIGLYSITVDDLLRHRGGWNRSIAGPGGTYLDLTYQERQVALDMGLSSPPGRDATVRWIMGKPLQFSPGTEKQYSNIGYLLLGLIAEKVAGIPLIDQFRQDLFSPMGVSADQVVAGRTFQEDQDAREPYYDSAGYTSTNVFYPDFSAQPTVAGPYGTWDHEARIGQGGIVADPLSILEFLDNYQVNGDDIGGPRPAPGGWRWNHTGSLNGTNTLARQRGDGINYVVFFNKKPSGTSYSSQVRTIFDGILDSGQISSWPTNDIRDLEGVLDADLNYDGLVNEEDFVFWELAFENQTFGDVDSDGDTDGNDFLKWQRQYGDSAIPLATASSVPELSTWVSLAVAALGASTLRRSQLYWLNQSGIVFD